MKVMHVVGVLLLVAGGIGFGVIASRSNTTSSPGAKSVQASSAAPRNLFGGIDAASWISRHYIERQTYVQNHPDREGVFEREQFVPPEYADRVASCVVRAFDANPTNVAGKGQDIGRQWRSRIPIVQDIRDQNTDQYTQDQIGQGRDLARAIMGVNMLCKDQLVPSGAFDAAWEEHRQLISDRGRQRQIEGQQRIACDYLRYLLDEINKYPGSEPHRCG